MINSLRNTSLSKNFVTVIAIALISALAMPALAAAASPTDDQYKNTGEAIAGLAEGGGGGPATTAATGDSQIGSLPFTGLDVLGLFVIAIAVAGSGLLLQRAVRKQ